MKALTDKIIELLQKQSDEEFNHMAKNALNNAIDSIIKIESEANFEEVARVVIKFMAQKIHPHHSVVITSTQAELLEGELSTGNITEYLVD